MARLRVLREKAGYVQAQAARELGVSRPRTSSGKRTRAEYASGEQSRSPVCSTFLKRISSF